MVLPAVSNALKLFGIMLRNIYYQCLLLCKFMNIDHQCLLPSNSSLIVFLVYRFLLYNLIIISCNELLTNENGKVN